MTVDGMATTICFAMNIIHLNWNRPLKRYEIPASKLVLELGYSIDYEDEKEDFDPDEADTVEQSTVSVYLGSRSSGMASTISPFTM